MDDIQSVMNRYTSMDIANISCMFGGYTNRNYKISTDKKDYLLKIHLNKNVEDIVPEILILEYLKNTDIPVAQAIPDKDNNYINKLGNDYAVVYEYIDGHHPEVNTETAKQIAKAAVKLNLLEVPASFTQKNWVNLEFCNTVIQQMTHTPYNYPDIYEYFIEQTTYLQEPLSEKVTKGLVHGDLFPDNTIFNGDKLLAILDFEVICVENILHELGTAINGFCYVNNELDEELYCAFLSEYQKDYTLDDIEKQLLPFYIQWGAHCMLAWHLLGVMENNDPIKYKRALEFMDRVVKLRKMPSSF